MIFYTDYNKLECEHPERLFFISMTKGRHLGERARNLS